MTVAMAFEAYRLENGLTKVEMAHLLRASPPHYNEWIRNHRPVPLLARRMAYKLGIPAEILLA